MKMSTTKFAKRIGVFTAAVCFSPVLFADEIITGDQIEEPHHHNDMALFTGVTNTAEENSATIGLEYESRLPFVNEVFGVGAVWENVSSQEGASLIGGSFVMHPWRELKANFTTGIESEGEKSSALLRVGLAYEFHLNQFAVTPTYNLDLVNGHHANVLGLSFGMGF